MLTEALQQVTEDGKVSPMSSENVNFNDVLFKPNVMMVASQPVLMDLPQSRRRASLPVLRDDPRRVLTAVLQQVTEGVDVPAT